MSDRTQVRGDVPAIQRHGGGAGRLAEEYRSVCMGGQDVHTGIVLRIVGDATQTERRGFQSSVWRHYCKRSGPTLSEVVMAT